MKDRIQIGTIPPGTYLSDETIKRWSDHLAEEARRANYFAKFMGPEDLIMVKDGFGCWIMEQVQFAEQHQTMEMAAA